MNKRLARSTDLPRIVIVTRKSPFELLVERAGTVGQARFQIEASGLDFSRYERVQHRYEDSLHTVESAIPAIQRRVRIDREELDRFLFAPDDLIVVVGQDGLIPNVAKYLGDQLVFGINPHPELYDGMLCRHDPISMFALLEWASTRRGAFGVERRVMVEARRDDGQRVVALNEIFVGHRSHQSARYVLRADNRDERQSSSGLICATGTGKSGWMRSILEQRRVEMSLPEPVEERLVWLVREPFPSISTGTSLDLGEIVSDEFIEMTSEQGEGGIIFGDGIESDWIEFVDGQIVRLTVAERKLQLVVPMLTPVRRTRMGTREQTRARVVA